MGDRFSDERLPSEQNKSPTSMMMAKGTQHATAQEIPTKLTRMMAYIGQLVVFDN